MVLTLGEVFLQIFCIFSISLSSHSMASSHISTEATSTPNGSAHAGGDYPLWKHVASLRLKERIVGNGDAINVMMSTKGLTPAQGPIFKRCEPHLTPNKT